MGVEGGATQRCDRARAPRRAEPAPRPPSEGQASSSVRPAVRFRRRDSVRPFWAHIFFALAGSAVF